MTDEEQMKEIDIYYATLEDRPDIGWFLQGHLVIEYLLKKRLVQYGYCTEKGLEKHGFYTLVNKCADHGLIDVNQKSVLLIINNKRNSYAHDLGYRPTREEWIELWRAAMSAFSDMTDGLEQGLAELQSVSSLEDVDCFYLNEFFVQICHDL